MYRLFKLVIVHVQYCVNLNSRAMSILHDGMCALKESTIIIIIIIIPPPPPPPPRISPEILTFCINEPLYFIFGLTTFIFGLINEHYFISD